MPDLLLVKLPKGVTMLVQWHSKQNPDVLYAESNYCNTDTINNNLDFKVANVELLNAMCQGKLHAKLGEVQDMKTCSDA